MTEIELSDGTVLEFPDSMSQDQIKAAIDAKFGKKNTDAAPEVPRMTQEELDASRPFERQVGLTARAAIEGAADMAGIFTNPITALANLVLPQDKQLQPVPQATSDALTAAGVPTPQGATERVVNRGVRGATGAALTMGGGKLAVDTGNQLAQNIGRMVASSPKAQIVGGITADVSGQTAQEMGANPAVQTAASLAGGIVGGRMAGPSRGSPEITAKQDAIKAADNAGIRSMTSDTFPPSNFATRWVRRAGDMIPVAGTAGPRAAQQVDRVKAIRNLLQTFGADDAVGASDSVMTDLLRKHGDDVGRYTKLKGDVFTKLSSAGAVPVSRTVTKIDDQIAKLSKLNTKEVQPVIAKLEDWKRAIQGQNIEEVETLRKMFGDAFSGPDQTGLKKVTQGALKSIYPALREDMGDFISQHGDRRDVTRWTVANKRLSNLMGEMDRTALKSALNKGEVTPETIRGLLFSKKPSDVKALYKALTPEGRERARAAVLYEALQKSGGIDDISPRKFATQVGKLGTQTGILFRSEDLRAIDGLAKALKLTQHASEAALSPPTGVNAVPLLGIEVAGGVATGIPGAGTGLIGGVGLLTRAYESRAVRSVLMQLSRAKTGSAEEAEVFKRLIATMQAQTRAEE